jgi:hypothetical protein
MMSRNNKHMLFSEYESIDFFSTDSDSNRKRNAEKRDSSIIKKSEKDRINKEGLRENVDPNEPDEIQGFPKNKKQKEEVKQQYDKANKKADDLNGKKNSTSETSANQELYTRSQHFRLFSRVI